MSSTRSSIKTEPLIHPLKISIKELQDKFNQLQTKREKRTWVTMEFREVLPTAPLKRPHLNSRLASKAIAIAPKQVSPTLRQPLTKPQTTPQPRAQTKPQLTNALPLAAPAVSRRRC